MITAVHLWREPASPGEGGREMERRVERWREKGGRVEGGREGRREGINVPHMLHNHYTETKPQPHGCSLSVSTKPIHILYLYITEGESVNI